MTRWLLALLLLAACDAPAARPPPRLRFVSSVVDAGRRPPGRAQAVRISWVCRGAGRVRVVGTRSDCGCARVSPMPPWVTAGEHGVLQVVLGATRRTGPQRMRIRVYLDAPPPGDVADVEVRAAVSSNSEGPAGLAR